MFGQILDPQKDLVTQMTLVLIDLNPTDLHLGLSHTVQMGQILQGKHVRNGRGGRGRQHLISTMFISLQMPLENGFGWECLVTRGTCQTVI